MKIYSRYIAYNLLLPVIVITITLTAVIWLTQSLRFIDYIVNRGLDVTTFLYLSSLIVPSLLMIIMPIALFISVVFIYNKLSSESELVVLNSSGLSNMALARPALLVALIVAVCVYGISVYLLPKSYREFKDTQAYIRNNHASILLQEGVFSSPVKDLTFYVERRSSDGLLAGIIIFDGRLPEKSITMTAEKGIIIQTTDGAVFDLINGMRQELDKKTNKISVLYFDSYPVDIGIYTQNSSRQHREVEELFVEDLLFPQGNISSKMRKKYFAEGHHRLIWPLYSFVFVLVAVSTLLSSQLSRTGQWKRILTAAAFVVLIVVCDLIAKNLTAKHNKLVFLMYANIAIPFISCFYVLLSNRVVTLGGYFRKNKAKPAT